MAKLSAHGSKELARFVRTVRDEADGSTHRTTYSFRDDGRVLVKRDVKRPTYSVGIRWRVAKRMKAIAIGAYLEKARVRLAAGGFTEETP